MICRLRRALSASTSRHGWSLLELIVGLGVGAIVMSGAGMLYMRMQQNNRMAVSMAASQADLQTTWALVNDLFASHTVDEYKPPGWTGSCTAPRVVDCPASWGLPASTSQSCVEFCRRAVDADTQTGFRELITVGQGCAEDWWNASIGARVIGLNLKTVGSGVSCAATCSAPKQRSDIRMERAVFKCGTGLADKVARTFVFPDQFSVQSAMGGVGAPMNACLKGIFIDGVPTKQISVQTGFGYAGQLAASKAAITGQPLMDLEAAVNQQTLEFQTGLTGRVQEIAPTQSVQNMYGVAAAAISNCDFSLASSSGGSSAGTSTGGSTTTGLQLANPVPANTDGRLTLTTPTDSKLQYQANRQASGSLGNEAGQVAVNGVDFRDIDTTNTLTPASAKSFIKLTIGKTLVTGLGAGDAWGTRALSLRSTDVVIYDVNDVTVEEPCPIDRVPIGKPMVAKTSELGRFLCAKLRTSPRISLGRALNVYASSAWAFNSFVECPEGHVALGIDTPMSGLWSVKCAPISISQAVVIEAGTNIPAGTVFTAGGSCQVKAIMQSDGNFVIYHGLVPVWQTYTGNNAGAFAKFDQNGKLIVQKSQTDATLLYPNNVAQPPNPNNNPPGTGRRLILQTDSNLVIYDSANVPLWNSGTANVSCL